MHYRNIVEYCLLALKADKLVLVLSTPVWEEGQRVDLHAKMDFQVQERNQVVETLSNEFKLHLNDLYSLMMKNSDDRTDDGYQYQEGGHKVLAVQVAHLIRPLL